MNPVYRLGLALLAALSAAALLTTGCGTPGAPLSPSLNLPDAVTNLAAVRTGNEVALTWTMPKKNTDKMLLKGNVPVRICRRDVTQTCATVPDGLLLAPGAQGAFTETLPPELAAGAPRVLTYFVELKNRNGRSAGLSNGAAVLAGEAPAAVEGLTAEVRKDGVVLLWTPDGEQVAVRLQRKLLTSKLETGPETEPKTNLKAGPKTEPGALAPPPEPLEQSLLVDAGGKFAKSGQSGQTGQGPDRAIDRDIRLGETYEYRAQRVARVSLDEGTGDGQTQGSQASGQTLDRGSQTLELAGPLSQPVRVEALDVFPPAVPTGLAAVATAADAAANPPTGPSIDLSWQPVTDADLAGYVIYRRENGADWQRISPTPLQISPAFHDPNVLAGHTYIYAVSAVDQGGHESARSAETEETVPNP